MNFLHYYYMSTCVSKQNLVLMQNTKIDFIWIFDNYWTAFWWLNYPMANQNAQSK